MPRPLRIEYEGVIYHVMNRRDRCGPIFLERFEKYCSQRGARILWWHVADHWPSLDFKRVMPIIGTASKNLNSDTFPFSEAMQNASCADINSRSGPLRARRFEQPQFTGLMTF